MDYKKNIFWNSFVRNTLLIWLKRIENWNKKKVKFENTQVQNENEKKKKNAGIICYKYVRKIKKTWATCVEKESYRNHSTAAER